jgi:hypothetical protein
VYNGDMRVNFSIPPVLHEDTKKYCKDNGLDLSKLIRHLLRIEVYYEKSLERGCEDEEK